MDVHAKVVLTLVKQQKSPPYREITTMLRVQKVRAAAIGLLAAVLLAGCAAGSEADPATSGMPTGDTQKPQTRPDQRPVRGVDVIDPVTVVVTPTDEGDDLFGEKIIVHVNDITAPAEGECGYDDAVATAAETAVDANWSIDYSSVTDGVYIDDKGEHHGVLNARVVTFSQTMVTEGMALARAGEVDSYLSNYQEKAQGASAGLWASCPGFGA